MCNDTSAIYRTQMLSQPWMYANMVKQMFHKKLFSWVKDVGGVRSKSNFLEGWRLVQHYLHQICYLFVIIWMVYYLTTYSITTYWCILHLKLYLFAYIVHCNITGYLENVYAAQTKLLILLLKLRTIELVLSDSLSFYVWLYIWWYHIYFDNGSPGIMCADFYCHVFPCN